MTSLTQSARRRPFLRPCLRANPRRVHVALPGSFPFVPLCGADKTGDENMHFIVDMNQVYEHPRICPDCAGHEDIPMMVLGEM